MDILQFVYNLVLMEKGELTTLLLGTKFYIFIISSTFEFN